MEKEIRLVDEKKIGEILGWSRQTLSNKRWAGNDGPPYIRLSARCIRYDIDEVMKWAKAREVRPGEQAA
jgi:predicted DNA-binding transcriptional regulator AlpA